mgnify:CR=1 FL=1
MLSFWLNSSFSGSGVELPFYYFIYHLGIVSTGAVILDLMFSEVSRFHPLAAFGRAATSVERVANPYHQSNLSNDVNTPYKAKLFGLLGCLGLIFPISFVVMISALFVSKIWLAGVMLDSVILYFCIGLTSMQKHVLAIAKPLENQRSCHMTHTSAEVHNLLKEGFDRSPMFNGRIQSIGPSWFGFDRWLNALFSSRCNHKRTIAC